MEEEEYFKAVLLFAKDLYKRKFFGKVLLKLEAGKIVDIERETEHIKFEYKDKT